MATLPEWARKKCGKCQGDIAYVRTTRQRKGAPVDIAVDFLSDPGEGGTVPVGLGSDILYGNPVPKSQAAAMRAAGVGLHAEHATSCQKRGTSQRASYD
jgi:hypothetical protein